MHGAVWAGAATAWHDDVIDDALFTGRAPVNPTQIIFRGTGGPSFSRQQALSSQHAGGVQVGLFDGSVRFLSENLDFKMTGVTNASAVDSIYEYLIHKSDGNVIGEF